MLHVSELVTEFPLTH